MQMDKASIVKDAISYIQELQEKERKILGEIAQLESTMASEKQDMCNDSNQASQNSFNKKKTTVHDQQQLSSYDSGGSRSSSSSPSLIQVLEVARSPLSLSFYKLLSRSFALSS